MAFDEEHYCHAFTQELQTLQLLPPPCNHPLRIKLTSICRTNKRDKQEKECEQIRKNHNLELQAKIHNASENVAKIIITKLGSLSEQFIKQLRTGDTQIGDIQACVSSANEDINKSRLEIDNAFIDMLNRGEWNSRIAGSVYVCDR